jgi:hypothetical protein
MSHYVTTTGRPYVECDERVVVEGGFPARCGKRSFGDPDRWDKSTISILDLPRGWSVAPYTNDYDHGATRTSLLDGRELKPFPHLIGIKGDLHTCPACNRRRRR